MPNWCEAELTVRGSDLEIDHLIEAVKAAETPFDFTHVIPYPEPFRSAEAAYHEWERQVEQRSKLQLTAEVRATWLAEHPRPEDGFNHGGYEWRKKHWGTKWNLGDD